jgi:acyl-CoA synthetase (AMP-forming)/AMP-acid ligase II
MDKTMACAVLEPEMKCREHELREYCEDALGSSKIPKHFCFVEELQNGSSGKVQSLKVLDLALQDWRPLSNSHRK